MPTQDMKAVVCREIGPLSGLALSDVDDPVPAAGEILLRVEACGINFYDGLAVEGKYQTKPALPFSPGGEVAGFVEVVGDGVSDFVPGDRVIAFCGFGGYAERVCVRQEAAHILPANVDSDDAAAMLIAHATAYHALKDRAALQSGETVLVLGAAGGVGLAAVELASLMGARVIAAASTKEKLSLARDYGAEACIDYATDDLRSCARELTGGRGVDVVVDPVGGKLAGDAMRSLAPNGRHLVIGFAAGDIPTIGFNQLLLKQISLIGVLWGAFARSEPQRNATNLKKLIDWLEKGKLRPYISETWPLERYDEALGRVMRRETKGKVVLRLRKDATAPMPTAAGASA